MDKKYQVLTNRLPEELIRGLEPTAHVIKVTLGHNVIEYGDLSLPIEKIQKYIEIMRKNALDKVLGLYRGDLTTENKFSKKDCLKISTLEGRCTGVQVIKKPEINPETLWLANFGIGNDTLHYKSREMSGVNQIPSGFVNVEFIAYAPATIGNNDSDSNSSSKDDSIKKKTLVESMV